MVRQDENRYVVGRILAARAGPGRVPWRVTAAEHLAGHDVRADILEEVADDVRIDRVRATGVPLLLAPAGGFEHPLVQAQPAFADRVLEALVRPSDEAVERDRDLAHDGAHTFKTPSRLQIHRSAQPSVSRGHAPITTRSRRWRT